MKQRINFLLLASLLSGACWGHPDESQDKETSPWGGKILLGGINNSGNTQTKSLNGKTLLQYKTTQWHNEGSLEGKLSKNQGVTTSETAEFNGKLRYAITKRDYTFGNATINYDKFGTYDMILREVIGYGRQLYKNKKTKLNVEIGPGGRHSKISGTSEYFNEFILNLNAILNHKLSKAAKFSQTLSFNIGEKNTQSQSISAITTKMTANLSLELSYTIVHNSKIPDNSKNKRHTDKTTKLNIVYSF